jgi:hypothetical protein
MDKDHRGFTIRRKGLLDNLSLLLRCLSEKILDQASWGIADYCAKTEMKGGGEFIL